MQTQMNRLLSIFALCLCAADLYAADGFVGIIDGQTLVDWMREEEALLERRPAENVIKAGLYTGYKSGQLRHLYL